MKNKEQKMSKEIIELMEKCRKKATEELAKPYVPKIRIYTRNGYTFVVYDYLDLCIEFD